MCPELEIDEKSAANNWFFNIRSKMVIMNNLAFMLFTVYRVNSYLFEI